MRRLTMKKMKYMFMNTVQPISAWLFAFCSFLPAVVKLFEKTEEGLKFTGKWWHLLITIFYVATATVVFGFQFYFFVKKKRFAEISMRNKLYDAAMKAQEKSNEAKMKSILQITYGNVPEWNPRNYEKNVLLYDGHEHLRRILLDMRDALRDVLSTEEKRIDADAVSVDLLYCYPNKEYDGLLPIYSIDIMNSENLEEDKKRATREREAWRVITSGNSSIMATREGEKIDIREFLKKENSFYNSLAKKGYEFRNSKINGTRKRKRHLKLDAQGLAEKTEGANGSKTVSNGFILNTKDKEYNNVGSVVGQMLAIRNDQPTVVLLHAILTITTFGVKLCADDNGIKEKDYEEIFRSSFINPYKFMIESELAQLYIRHQLREQNMCRKTGIANISETANPKTRECMLQDICKRECRFKFIRKRT